MVAAMALEAATGEGRRRHGHSSITAAWRTVRHSLTPTATAVWISRIARRVCRWVMANGQESRRAGRGRMTRLRVAPSVSPTVRLHPRP
jgi:hypothetical protein